MKKWLHNNRFVIFKATRTIVHDNNAISAHFRNNCKNVVYYTILLRNVKSNEIELKEK